MRLAYPLLPCYSAVIPRSFELFYAATVMRTLATTLRMTTERETAHRATQLAYAVMLTLWCDRQSQSPPENACYVKALATWTVADFRPHQNSSATSFRTVDGVQQPDDEFELLRFDIRDGLRELARNANAPWPSRPDAPFSALVADSDQWRREAMAAWLTQLGATTVGEAATVAEARAHALASGQRDLAILNLDQPDGSGVELVTDLRSHGWRRIVVLASPDHPYTVPLAFQAGAHACLLKSTSPVSNVFRTVPYSDVGTEQNGAPVLDVARSSLGPTGTSYDLSNREVEVLQLVAAGHSNKEIGQILRLSALTIKGHLSRIGRKLGTGDRARMVVHAMRASIIN